MLDKLTAEIKRIVRSPKYTARMADQGAMVIGNSPTELAAFRRSEIDRYRKIA